MGSTSYVWLAIALGLTIGHGSVYRAQGVDFADLFPARIRYSGLSPFVAVFLLAEYNSPWPVAAYMAGMAGMALLSVLCTLSLRELKTA